MLGEEVVGAGGVAVEEERGGAIGGAFCGGGVGRGRGRGLGFCLGSGLVLWLGDFGGHCGGCELRI